MLQMKQYRAMHVDIYGSKAIFAWIDLTILSLAITQTDSKNVISYSSTLSPHVEPGAAQHTEWLHFNVEMCVRIIDVNWRCLVCIHIYLFVSAKIIYISTTPIA